MPEHQISMVLDLNKCLGCQTCTMACKKQWTDGDGMDYMYWNNVETRPGQGYPRNWDRIGGGFENGKLRPPKSRRRRTTGKRSSTTTRSAFSRAASRPCRRRRFATRRTGTKMWAR